MIPDSLKVVIDVFNARYHRQPRFAASAPGRVNLIGEHTDYSEGFVLPIAIDRRTVMVADLAQSPRSNLYAVDLGETIAVDLTRQLSPLGDGHWANYLLGVAQQFRERGFSPPNLDIAVTSTVPIGAGLSSSAAVEVAVATLLEHITGARLDPTDKALLCQKAEHTFPGTPCGIMDMLIAATAKPDHAQLIDCRDNSTTHIRLPDREQASLLVADTQVKHSLADGGYAQRRATCVEVARKLGVNALRDATTRMLQQSDLTPEQRRRAEHVVNENARTQSAAEALESGNLESFGDLMFQSHDSLRDLYEVSCPELNTIVDSARRMRQDGMGVFGARMTGGGFGGCAILYCAPDAIAQVSQILLSDFDLKHGRKPLLFSTFAAGGAKMHPTTRL